MASLYTSVWILLKKINWHLFYICFLLQRQHSLLNDISVLKPQRHWVLCQIPTWQGSFLLSQQSVIVLMQPSVQATCFGEHWNENGVSSFYFSGSKITDKEWVLPFQGFIPEMQAKRFICWKDSSYCEINIGRPNRTLSKNMLFFPEDHVKAMLPWNTHSVVSLLLYLDSLLSTTQ